MNESGLRWRGRLSSLKIVGVILLVLGAILLIAGLANLSTANKNVQGPQQVTIDQLARDEFGVGYYVSVSGIAMDEAAYTEEDEDGTTTRSFYYMIDPETGAMILIEHTSPLLISLGGDLKETTITGMTRRSPTELKDLIESDLSEFESYDLYTTAAIYIKDGATPPAAGTAYTMIVVGGLLVVLGLVPFFFRGTVFQASPLDPTAPVPTERPGLQATGTFQKLQQLEPVLEFGRRMQRFTKAVANFIPMPGGQLLIYIHHVAKAKAYGITVKTTKSDWGLLLDQNNVQSVEAGKLYGWRDQRAIRFQYADRKGKVQDLYLLLESPGAQKLFVQQLENMGFGVSTGDALPV
ncbi:MAG: hypothetical protein JXA37_09705 [Chloroflexia bacterium]|nr:hypothetical protein [Chloroflexia bacterium]